MNLTPQKIAWMTSTGQGPHPNFYIKNIKDAKKGASKRISRGKKEHRKHFPRKGDNIYINSLPFWLGVFPEVSGPITSVYDWLQTDPSPSNIKLPDIKGSGFVALAASYAISAGLIIYGPAKFKLVGTALLAVPDILIYGLGEFLA